MKGVREAIQAAGAIAIDLPPDSPDLNPIEPWWADFKRQPRHLAVDTEQDLRAAVRNLRASLRIEELLAWFAHWSPAFSTSELAG